MSENRINTGYYRDQSKRDRTPTWQWVRKMVNKAYTSQEWIQMFKELPDATKWRILQDMNPVPKENVVKSDSSITVSFKIEGMDQVKSIDGQLVDDVVSLPDSTDGNDETT